MGSDMSYAYVQADAAAIERRELVALVDQLQTELAEQKAQLESTEKSYDKVLLENIEFQDREKAIRMGQLFGMGPEPARRWLQERRAGKSAAITEAGAQAVRELGNIPTRRTWSLPDGSVTASALNLPTDPKADDIADELFAEAYRESRREGVPFRPPTAEPVYSQRSEPQVIRGLQAINTDLNRRRKEAQGDRAKMKETLVSTQNACRRHKKRIAWMKPQLEALTEVANAAFPLYLALADAHALVDGIGAAEEASTVIQINCSPKLKQLCEDFHNKFNEAAEALTPPTVVKMDGMEIRYE